MPHLKASWRPFTPEEIEQVRARLISLVDATNPGQPELGHNYNADVSRLLAGPDYNWDDARKLSDRLLLDHFLDDASITYHRAFHHAADLTRGTWLRAIESPEWLAAMPAIIHGMNCTTEQQAIESAPLANAGLFAQADAAKRLRAQGFSIDLYGSGVRMETEAYARLCDLVYAESVARGGSSLFGRLKIILEPFWRPDFGRYVVSLNVNTTPRKEHSSTPLAYLYNLAVRITSQGTGRGTPRLSDLEYWQLVTDVCAIEGVEPYNVYEVSFPSGTRLVEFLSRLARLHFAFVLPQFDESDLPKALSRAFAWVDGTMESRLGWSMSQAMAFCEATTSRLPGRGGICIPKNAIRHALTGVTEPTFDAMWKAFVHAPGAANAQFKKPFEATAVNAFFKPLIAIDNDNAVVGLRSVSATGWYEAIADALRTVAGVTDTDESVQKVV